MTFADSTLAAQRLSDRQGLHSLVDLLVCAKRILYAEGTVDGMGHISARHPTEPGQFFLACSRAPGLVQRQDVMLYDLDGEDITSLGLKPYLERFVHAEIYRQRLDVQAMVHSHSASVIPSGAT
ncbi:hypothetical protein RD110_19170 [Rhodoferax koreense]|uniref:Class II aldolase/adducin N-terminal domain-containing protein n=1 Tax=Rhodoferax koreensis TaxID=1842727 RepID=A0A1P8JZ87_9BURK|nr:class II aldolase/adducin family protein [Rhodoferax koreense]APW39067.1 hypothetical protein RD110_19170 [Rhodoferax koreense]